MRGVGAAPPTVTAFALLLATAAPAPARAAGPTSVEQARQAAAQVSFEGVLDVLWSDGGATRTQRLTVEAADGNLLVLGPNRVMARSPFERLVARNGRGWDEVWLPGVGPGARPDGGGKYRIADLADGPVVAGRPTRTVEISEHDVVRERMYLDTATALLLRRDQYDAGGGVARTMAFETLAVRPPSPAIAAPRSPAHHAPQPVPAGRVASAGAPDGLDDGYRRLGVFRTGDALHVLYSDGLYDLSVFQQGGRLRRSDLPPSGDRVAVGRATGWRYAWAGGQLVVWAAKGRVFTAVSDAPVDQLLLAVRSLPELPARRASLAAKLRRACQAMMDPLA
jgi:hypothetical protein